MSLHPKWSWRRLSPRWDFLAVALTVLVLYAPTLSYDLVWDDLTLIVHNRLLEPSEAWRIPSSSYWTVSPGQSGPEKVGLYRPLTIASFYLNRRVFGAESGTSFHALNLLLYLALCLLVLILLRRWVRDRGWAFAGTLLFAVHPMHVEAVAFVSARGELLCALLLVAGTVLHRPGRSTLPRALGVAVCYALALLSKETALLFPLWLVALDLLESDVPPRSLPRRQWPTYALLLAATAGYFLLRHHALGLWLSQSAPDAWRAMDALYWFPGTLGRYLGLTLFPYFHRVLYDFREVTVALTPTFWLCSVALIALPIAVWRLPASRVRWLGLTAFLLFLLPVTQVWRIPGIYLAERFLLLPTLGAVLLLTFFLRWLAAYWPRPIRILTALLAVTWAVNVLWFTPAWSSREALFPRMALDAPRHPVPWMEMGLTAITHDRADSAEVFFRRALDCDPLAPKPRKNLGALLSRQERWSDAATVLRPFADPPRPDLEGCLMLAAAYVKLGQGDEVLRVARVILDQDASNVAGWTGLGVGYLLTDRPVEAVAPLRKALALAPDDFNAFANLSAAYHRTGQRDLLREAQAAWIRANPGHPMTGKVREDYSGQSMR